MVPCDNICSFELTNVTSPSSANDIGVPYIFMSKSHGTPLSEYEWPWFTDISPLKRSAIEHRPPTDAGKEKTMRGEQGFELSQHPLEKNGSLFEDNGEHVVKECLSPGFVWKQRDILDINRGPYDQELDYYKSLYAAMRKHAEELPMETHLFCALIPDPSEYSSWTSFLFASDHWNAFATAGKKIDCSRNLLDYCIVGDLVEDMARTFSRDTMPGEWAFPTRHPDLSVNNIFVDDDLKITWIIDWGFASPVPYAEPLTTPGMLYSRYLPGPPLAAAFRAGFEEEAGPVEPQIWTDSESI